MDFESNWRKLKKWMNDKGKREVKLGSVIKEPEQKDNIFVCRKFLKLSGKIYADKYVGFSIYSDIRLDNLNTVKDEETRTDVLIIDIQKANRKPFMMLIDRGETYVLSAGVEIDQNIPNKIDYARNEIAKNMI